MALYSPISGTNLSIHTLEIEREFTWQVYIESILCCLDRHTTTIPECATSCCKDDNCITWQFRHDVGCFHGADLRLGMEKDGPAAWCSDHKSYIWHGQNLVWKGDASRQLACNEHTWNPNEQSGQCLGLGDVRLESSKTARDCMHACCDDETCNSWQWNEIVSVYFIIIFMQQLCIYYSHVLFIHHSSSLFAFNIYYFLHSLVVSMAV